MKHMNRNHNGVARNLDGPNNIINDELQLVGQDLDLDDENENHLDLEQAFEENVDPEDDQGHQLDYTRAISLFVLKLREEKKLPANACSDVVCELSELFALQSVEVRESLMSVLNRNGIEPGTVDGFEEILSPFHRISQACCTLKTQQRQKKYFAENFAFVQPEEILLGLDDNEKPETFQYIPIKKLLQALLKHEDVFA